MFESAKEKYAQSATRRCSRCIAKPSRSRCDEYRTSSDVYCIRVVGLDLACVPSEACRSLVIPEMEFDSDVFAVAEVGLPTFSGLMPWLELSLKMTCCLNRGRSHIGTRLHGAVGFKNTDRVSRADGCYNIDVEGGVSV